MPVYNTNTTAVSSRLQFFNEEIKKRWMLSSRTGRAHRAAFEASLAQQPV